MLRYLSIQNSFRSLILTVSATLTCVLLLALVGAVTTASAGAKSAQMLSNTAGIEHVQTKGAGDSTEQSLVGLPVAPATPGCGLGWYSVTTPNQGNGSNDIQGLKVIADNDIWAVGSYQNASNIWQATSLHWDGTQWAVVTPPQLGTSDNMFYDISAVASDDVWAVGQYFDVSSSHFRGLIQHWDGTVWSIVTSPNIAGGDNVLKGVDVVSSDDIWAVGFGCVANCPLNPSNAAQTLIVHWDGSGWSVVANPNYPGENNYLYSVSAVAADDIWAVGFFNACGGCVANTLVEHWDGTGWSLIASPNAGTSTNYLYRLSASSSSDVWAVGYYYVPGQQVWNVLVLHWNGTGWSIVSVPHVGAGDNYGRGVKAFGPDDVWVVGTWFGPSGLTLHWDGTIWNVVPGPNAATGSNLLVTADGLSGSSVWAGGRNDRGWDWQAITQHYYDPCVTPTPSNTPTITPTSTNTNTPTVTSTSTNTDTPTVTPTSTPTDTPTQTPTPTQTATSTHTDTATATLTPTDTPTSTSTPTETSTSTETSTPTETPTATSTACTIEFNDVPPGSSFYQYVRCLACRGVLGGYPDGTFRPGNEITRGQIAKIVSNAADFQDDVSGRQTYADVLSTDTFWLWIERLSVHQVMGGYDCGGPGEPCDSDNRPYFRAGSNATRGQLSKIVSNAAGFAEIHTEQTFTDVQPTHTFYQFIERLVSRQIIAGYPCGGPGEPCDAENRPYFRAANSVTRGQAAKIVGNTFFPNCETHARRSQP